MTAVGDFVDHPIDFCSDNIVVVTCGTPQMNGATLVKLTLIPETQHWPGSKKGHPCNVYELVRADAGTHETFDSYWCPFAANFNGGNGVVVGLDARFLFTDRMTGCTLGIGSKTPTGNRLVLHANSQTAGLNSGAATPRGQLEAQAADQQQVLQAQATTLGHNIKTKNMIAPSKYGGGFKDLLGTPKQGTIKNASTTFGLLDLKKQDWHFYTLMYRINAMVYQHEGCKKWK
jgi:hypothetical protein